MAAATSAAVDHETATPSATATSRKRKSEKEGQVLAVDAKVSAELGPQATARTPPFLVRVRRLQPMPAPVLKSVSARRAWSGGSGLSSNAVREQRN